MENEVIDIEVGVGERSSGLFTKIKSLMMYGGQR